MLYSSYVVEDEKQKEKFEIEKGIKLRHNLWYQPETNTYFSIDTTLYEVNISKTIFFISYKWNRRRVHAKSL